MLMAGGECRADRAAGISCRRLNPDVADGAVAQHFAVGDAIERDPAGEAQLFHAGFGGERPRKPQHHFFRHCLDRGGKVHLALGQPDVRLARRAAEQRVEARIGHGQPGAIIEIVEVEPERAVGFEIDEMVENFLRVFRLAIGREPHDLVLAGIDLEAGVIGEGRIEQAERMREMDLLGDGEIAAAPDAGRTRGPFADAVHGEHRRLIERRRIEGGSRMA